MNEQNRLGPLSGLAGTWEGTGGEDTAPSDDRGTEQNKFRERTVFEEIVPAENHEQKLVGLRYHTQAWRIGESQPFHDETGYFLWDPKAGEVLKCFTIPRGVSVLAGGKAGPEAKTFKLAARAGSPTFGICSNPFLDEEFKTVEFEFEMTFPDSETFKYSEATRIRIKGQDSLFEHKDGNTMRKMR